MKINNYKNKPLDFIALGRLCIDLNPNEFNKPMEESMTFKKYVGGSPANITVGASKLGLKTGFIGKVSDDQMGRFAVNYMKNLNIDVSQIAVDKEGGVTGLTFTEIKSPTDCSIIMYRDNVSDLNLTPEEINESYISQAKFLLISGTALAKNPSREAVFIALEYAKKNNVKIIFELDYRPYTWKNKLETSIYYKLVAEQSNVIIGTREEYNMVEYALNQKDNDEYTANWLFKHSAEIVVIKHGENGSVAYTKDGSKEEAEVFPANIIKTFGAGDAFASSFIYGLLKKLSIKESLELGSASASIVISKHSCSDAMPYFSEIQDYISEHKMNLKK